MDTNKEQLQKVAQTTTNESLKQSIAEKLSKHDKTVKK
jgi:hypothetical protein